MCWGEDPEDYKDVYHEGIVSLRCSCYFTDKGGKEEYTIGKVFGANEQELTWGEFIAKCPDDTFGIVQKGELLDKMQKSADEAVGEWLDAVGGYHSQFKPIGMQSGRVSISESRISFDFRCDYEFYYEHSISRWTNEDDDWDEDTNILMKCLDGMDGDMDSDDVWFEIYLDDYDFDLKH